MLRTEFSKLLQPQQALHGNPLAKDLYKMLERNNFIITEDPDKEEDILAWVGKILSLSLHQDGVPPAIRRMDAVEDHLFKSVYIKGVKKMPRSDHYRRLNFSNNKGQPVSTIIMGENGVGKSSFYGSMEYVGMGEMKTAEIYNQQKEEYIRNLFSVKSDISTILKTVNEEITLDLTNPKVKCLPAFYISEWDIRELEKMPDFGPFIFSQLGVENFNRLLSFLISTRSLLINSLATYEELRGSIHSLRKEIEGLKFIITKRPTCSDDEMKSLITEDLPEFPELMVENRLVSNHNELITGFEQVVMSDEAFPLYSEYLKDLSEPSLSSMLEELKGAIAQHETFSFWFTKKRISEAIIQCRQKREEFIEFKKSMSEEITKLLESHPQSLASMIDDAFSYMTELANKTAEWKNSVLYAIIQEAEDEEESIMYLDDTINALQSRFNDLVNRWVEDIIQPTVRTLLFEYMKDENEDITIQYNEQQRSISAILVVTAINESGARSVGKINPRAYFNTFRFKMFVVSLKIALACCAKSIYQSNWPIVIDDVFNSSDFSNRSNMGAYINQICRTYDKLDNVNRMRFQLIFFTQDDVIGDAIFKGLQNQGKSAKLLRLHDYRCFSESQPEHPDNDLPYIDVGIELDSCDFG